MNNKNIDPKSLHIGIIGAGPAGYVAALHAAARGAQVTLIEKSAMGGTCLQKGCIPTKRLVSTAHLLEQIKAADKFGIQMSETASPRWEKIRSGLEKLIQKIENDLARLVESRRILLIQSKAKLNIDKQQDKTQVRIELEQGELIPVDKLLICTGSVPHQPANFPFDAESICTSDDVWRWNDLPRSLLIIGEGVIGSEFTFIFKSLGVAVTVLGMADKPLPGMDKSVSSIILREMKKQKIRFRGGRMVEHLEFQDGLWHAYASQSDEMPNESLGAAERVLVCTGRVPQCDGLGLQESGIEQSPNGCIRVDDYMATNIPQVYAAGDVVGGVMLAHAASEQAKIAIEHMLGEKTPGYDARKVPLAVFTNPEAASIGLSETEAVQQGLSIAIGTFDIRGLGKAQAMGEISGTVKLIAEQGSRRLIGAHIVAANATEMIHEAAVVMARQGSIDELIETVHAHPTLSEAILEAAEDVFGQACHKPGLAF